MTCVRAEACGYILEEEQLVLQQKSPPNVCWVIDNTETRVSNWRE